MVFGISWIYLLKTMKAGMIFDYGTLYKETLLEFIHTFLDFYESIQ